MPTLDPRYQRKPSREVTISIHPEQRHDPLRQYASRLFVPSDLGRDTSVNSIGQRHPDKWCGDCGAELQRVAGAWRCPWFTRGATDGDVLRCGRPYFRISNNPKPLTARWD